MVREWLGNQAAGGYVTYDDATGRYNIHLGAALAAQPALSVAAALLVGAVAFRVHVERGLVVAGLPKRWRRGAVGHAAVVRAGALGIAQFMPATAAGYGLADPFDAERAIDAQAHLMRDLLRAFASVPLALAA
jgi:transglycosylase-like protein with SLT domain